MYIVGSVDMSLGIHYTDIYTQVHTCMYIQIIRYNIYDISKCIIYACVVSFLCVCIIILHCVENAYTPEYS